MLRRVITVLLSAVLLAATPAYAEFKDELTDIQQRWAAARYNSNGAQRKSELRDLTLETDTLAKKYSDQPESYLWAGVIRGSLAEIYNNLSALTLVKEAKVNLEKSIELNPKAEDSYALGILGLMYSLTPGWPIAFGDDNKAQELLNRGLELSPGGMNINYFNAEYHFNKKEYKKALMYIEKAAQATPPYPPEKSLAVSNRQREIHELAEKIKAKIK